MLAVEEHSAAPQDYGQLVLDETSGKSLPEYMPVLGCALCRSVMAPVGEWRLAKQHRIPVCGGRVAGRPYCRGCMSALECGWTRPVPVAEGE